VIKALCNERHSSTRVTFQPELFFNESYFLTIETFSTTENFRGWRLFDDRDFATKVLS
jgi:hypothetical protein